MQNLFLLSDGVTDLSAQLDIGVASIQKVPIATPTNPYRSIIVYEPRFTES
jgi:hypothetical protein